MKYLLICWEELGIKKWEMIKRSDFDTFGANLLANKDVDLHTVFIIPVGVMVEGIWLQPSTHKAQRVDFFNFFEDMGVVYEKPQPKEELKEFVEEREKNRAYDTKYGWISPDGRYFHCEYQGHISLAERICFGMIETKNAEKYLEDNGWCKIYKSLLDRNYSVFVGGKHTITDAQMKTLIGLDLDNANHLSEMLCKN